MPSPSRARTPPPGRRTGEAARRTDAGGAAGAAASPAGNRFPGLAGGAARRAATGWSRGSRVRRRARPIRWPMPTRSAPAARRGTGNVSSTPRTGSACSCGPTSASSVRSASGPCTAGRSSRRRSGTGSISVTPAGDTSPRAWRSSSATASTRCDSTGSRPRSCRAMLRAAGWRPSSGCATREPSERFLQINGVYEDHVRYAITVEEFAARREEFDALLVTAR